MNSRKRPLTDDQDITISAYEKRIAAPRNQSYNQPSTTRSHQHVSGVYNYGSLYNTTIEPTWCFMQGTNEIGPLDAFDSDAASGYRDRLITAEWFREWDSAPTDRLSYQPHPFHVLTKSTRINLRVHAGETKEVLLDHYDPKMWPEGRKAQVAQDEENVRQAVVGIGKDQAGATLSRHVEEPIRNSRHNLQVLQPLSANTRFAWG